MEAFAEVEKEPGWPYHELGLALALHALGRDNESDAALAALISKGAHRHSRASESCVDLGSAGVEKWKSDDTIPPTSDESPPGLAAR
jgi:hypothetical protein